MKATYRFLLLFSAFLIVTGSLLGQGTTGSLNGTVVHEGAPLPGATITITSPSMQGARVAVSNVNGDFNFPAIPPGQYLVEFEMEGMATVSKTVRVGLARTERVNAEMQLSSLAEQITVTAAAPAVLETTEVQSNFTQEEVENLPIQRTVQATVQLAPGVNNNGPGAVGSATINAAVISGSYAYDSLYLINGAVTNENIRGQTQDLFIEDAIEETSILVGSISAEYGRFTGGVVSAITKSGGNEFSGSFRDSFTNPSWTAVSDYGEPKRESNMNETYEATLGGRIVRDRLWFFAAGRNVENAAGNFLVDSDIPFTTTRTDERYELKLTGQVTPKHSLVVSYLDNPVDDTPYCPFGCWDFSSIDADGRQVPSTLATANYNGILTSNLLLEAGYSARKLEFKNGGGDHITTDFTDARDIALGTWGYDFSYGGAWGSPIFCGPCDPETRENEYYNLKGTYYLATPGLGTHNIVAGYENFAESRYANNFQSGSNFDLYIYNEIAPTRTANGDLRPVVAYGDVINWVPIPLLSIAGGSDFVTDSIFVNDKWDLNSKWSFNIGARYDKNDGKDSAGVPISKDSNVSPRIGAIYDINGDGRFRVNASYSRYVSRIAEGVGGGAGGGNPWYVYYEYRGPTIGGPDSGLDSFDVLEQVFEWFIAEGFTDASHLIVSARTPGFNTRLDGTLKSPNVDEFTLGFGMQVGQKGFLRADFVDRSWNDFYAQYTAPNDQVESPITSGEFLDILETSNTNNLERTYQAVSIQASYRISDRFNIGGNYTWSELKGNTEGETRGLGSIADPIESYVEYKTFDRHNPVGYLLPDQTHKARIWLGYNLPMGAIGNLNFSLLERFDSGTPYSAQTRVSVSPYVNNPGYATPPSRLTYYFSDRGEYRWDDTTATDLAVNYEVPISKINLFVQADLINVFDEQAQVFGSTSISLLDSFDPFTETPVEGVHWEKSSTFGQATNVNHYQQPRTYRFSVGLRF